MSTVSAFITRFGARTAFGCAGLAMVVLPAVLANEVPAHGAQRTAIAAAADTSPSCPQAYYCLQGGADPQVRYVLVAEVIDDGVLEVERRVVRADVDPHAAECGTVHRCASSVSTDAVAGGWSRGWRLWWWQG